MSSIFERYHSLALRAVTVAFLLLVPHAPLVAEETAQHVSEQTIASASENSHSSSETQAAPKRDLQAAVASLRQSPQPEPEVSPWPLAKGLALCLAVFCVIVFLLKRLNPHSLHSGKRRLAVLERLPLSPKSSLVLIQVDGRTRVIAVGSEQVQMLDGWEKLRSPAREFGEVLATLPEASTELGTREQGKGAA
jgi:flagellar biosynthetic protein FliO